MSDIENVIENDSEIDAINEAFAEAEDLENTCETLGENLEADEVAQSCDEVGAELQDEPVENTDRLEAEENNTHDSEKDALSDSENDDISENNTHEVSEENETGTIAENTTVESELSGNSEQLEPEAEPVNFSDRLEEPAEPEPQPNPWDDAPKDVYFYEKIYEDGHLGCHTESAAQAYKMGWDIEHNYIPIADTEKSDVNGWIYRKELCPHKSERELQIEGWNREIFELKEELNRTDYKAIKYAEGVLTDEEYRETGILRQVWRRRINELEKLIAG